jgi:hypothetical protein
VFSRKIWCEVIKNKTAKNIQQAFDQIFKNAGTVPSVLETDRGSEYVGSADYFKNKKIVHRYKRGSNKAAFAG